jgi:hypothetical protein
VLGKATGGSAEMFRRVARLFLGNAPRLTVFVVAWQGLSRRCRSMEVSWLATELRIECRAPVVIALP